MAEVGLQDGVGLDDVFWFCVGALAVVSLVRLFLEPVIRRIKSQAEAADAFHDAWFGIPAAPGRDAIPGVMERLNSIDGELKRNGGSTVKDAVFTTKRNTELIGKILNRNNDALRVTLEAAGIEPPKFERFPEDDDNDAKTTKEQ